MSAAITDPQKTPLLRLTSLPTRLATWQRYAVAIAITAIVTCLHYGLDRYLLTSSVFTFYFASVILAAWYCGLGPSIVNVVLGVAWPASILPNRGVIF